ncbi:MAG: M48 family metalloprotease [candidate division WOR-3 bacterium]|nr:MAG: M48 family metalloprotease [candidate division WOR-3 bacterium]
MQKHRSATFWDIERHRTSRVYILFGFLVILYFISVFVITSVAKVFIYLRQSLYAPRMEFHLFGADTLYVMVIALIAAMVHWYYSNRNVVAKVLSLLNAQPPDKHDKYHYTFNNVVDEITTAAGGAAVERYIMPTGSMNAFALADIGGRKVVGLTEGLLSRATRDEMQAVVAHEIAHILSNDCLETTIACSLFGMYSEALTRLNKAVSIRRTGGSDLFERESHRDEFAAGFLAIPIFILLFFIDICSQLLNMFISREKEYRADAAAVRLTRNPQSLASILYRIGTHWRGAGSAGDRLRPIFILNPQYSKFDEDEGLAATLFSTHPPLSKRLQIILEMAHADFDMIAQKIDRDRTMKIAPVKKKPAALLMAEHDKAWKGPYTVLQLQALDWIEPHTRLKIQGQSGAVRASDIPSLDQFFKKRTEPMWRIRRICPICREWLVPQEYEGLYVWQCAFCTGILTEQGKLPRIIVREEKGFDERVLRLASLIRNESKKKKPRFNIMLNTYHPRSCPKCGKAMVHKFYSYAYHIEIDECQECKSIWFDANELEILQCLIEMESG